MAEELSVKQAATLLGVNRETVARWIRDGKLAATNVSGGTERPRWRIERAAIEALRRPKGSVRDVGKASRRLRQIEAKMAELQRLLREVQEVVAAHGRQE